MPTRFPATTKPASGTMVSGAGPSAAINLTLDEARYLGACALITLPTAPSCSVNPAVTGTAQSGQTLTSTQGTWAGANLVYETIWEQSLDGGTAWDRIVGGNGALTFVLAAAHVGAKVRCRVKARNAARPDGVAATSNVTATVA